MGVTYVVRKKTSFWEIHVGFEQKEKLLRDAGLHLMKYRWAINPSLYGVQFDYLFYMGGGGGGRGTKSRLAK